jgi:hypothetical protein
MESPEFLVFFLLCAEFTRQALDRRVIVFRSMNVDFVQS